MRYNSDGRRVLEIGCSRGEILFGLRELGYEVCGTDLSAEVIRFAGDVYKLDNLYCSEFPPSNLYGSFDVLVVSHVIEHVVAPKMFISECGRYLKNGGLLIILTPNISSIGYKVFKSYYPTVYPPFHLSFFNIKTLSLLIKDDYRLIEYKTETDIWDDWNTVFNSFVAFADMLTAKKWVKNNAVKDIKVYGLWDLVRLARVFSKAIQFCLFPLFFLVDRLKMGENITLVCMKN